MQTKLFWNTRCSISFTSGFMNFISKALKYCLTYVFYTKCLISPKGFGQGRYWEVGRRLDLGGTGYCQADWYYWNKKCRFGVSTITSEIYKTLTLVPIMNIMTNMTSNMTSNMAWYSIRRRHCTFEIVCTREGTFYFWSLQDSWGDWPCEK